MDFTTCASPQPQHPYSSGGSYRAVARRGGRHGVDRTPGGTVSADVGGGVYFLSGTQWEIAGRCFLTTPHPMAWTIIIGFCLSKPIMKTARHWDHIISKASLALIRMKLYGIDPDVFVTSTGAISAVAGHPGMCCLFKSWKIRGPPAVVHAVPASGFGRHPGEVLVRVALPRRSSRCIPHVTPVFRTTNRHADRE